MIKLKELINRVYDNKDCIQFEYKVKDDNGHDSVSEHNNYFIARFQRSMEDSKRWNMQVVLPRDRYCDSQVYNFDYVLPKSGMSLSLVAAIGLKYYHLYLKEEIQRKSNFDFVLGDLLKDM